MLMPRKTNQIGKGTNLQKLYIIEYKMYIVLNEVQ